MENFELFEEELKRNNLDLKKYDFEDRYLYALRQYYEDINTFWGIYVSKKNHKNSLLITLLTIPTYKKEEFLKLLNSLNEKYFNVSFFIMMKIKKIMMLGYHVAIHAAMKNLKQNFLCS